MRFPVFFSGMALALQLFSPASLWAVLPSGGEETSTTNWETDSLTAWDYVGALRGGTGVFLGNYGGSYWVLSAGHVGSSAFVLGGNTYSAITSSSVRINGVDDSGKRPDLVLFQIDPGSANERAYLDSFALLQIADKPMAVATEVRLIGRGDGSASPKIKSWGDNSIVGTATYSIADTNYGGTGYYTLDKNGVRVVLGDSGGGMFYQDGNTWVLAGIMSVADNLGDLGGHGMIAVALDLYADQILAAIPEPGTLAAVSGLLALGSVLVARRRNRVE